jgi:hypothetical protein
MENLRIYAVLLLSGLLFMLSLVQAVVALEIVIDPYEGINYDEINSYSNKTEEECYCWEKDNGAGLSDYIGD